MPRPSPDEAARKFVAIAAAAATRLGVFDALPCSLDALVAKVGPRSRSLIELLVGGGRLALDGDTLQTSSDGPFDDAGATLIVDVIRRDHPFDPDRDGWAMQLDAQALHVGPLLSLGAATTTLDLLDAADVFLDAGGGLGDATRAFLDRTPHGRAILVDAPLVIDAARRHLATFGDRITFVAADLRHDPLPACDLALISNVLHLHAAEDARRIIANVARTSSRVAIKDVALAEDRRGPLAALAFALATRMFGSGEVTTGKTLERRVAAAVSQVTIRRPATMPECVVVAGQR